LLQDLLVESVGRRRPQWRGERKAVLVRVPVALAQDLIEAAAREHRSVSEHCAALLAEVVSAQSGRVLR